MIPATSPPGCSFSPQGERGREDRPEGVFWATAQGEAPRRLVHFPPEESCRAVTVFEERGHREEAVVKGDGDIVVEFFDTLINNGCN